MRRNSRCDAGSGPSEEEVKRALTLGLPPFSNHYALGPMITKGGFSEVYWTTYMVNGERRVAKRALKRPTDAQNPIEYIAKLKSEIEHLKHMAGSLNVVNFFGAYEDERYVYIVMEDCQGGELSDRMATIKSEEQVARAMQDIFRTLSQCHARNIVHLDIKPGNFLYASKEKETGTLKAIDFGLSVTCAKDEVREDVGYDSTPWYIAPEVLSNKVTQAADMWSAGVMMMQLLTGRLPFTDKTSRKGYFSALAVFQSVLNDKIDWDGPQLAGVSDSAKDLLKKLLDRDHTQRITAKEALGHPWIHLESKVRQHKDGGVYLSGTVVQRLQQFAVMSSLRRALLAWVASELQEMMLVSHSKSLESIAKMLRLHDAQRLFERMDVHHSGSLGTEDLQAGLSQVGYKVDKSDVRQLTRNQEAMNREEMIAGTLNWSAAEKSEHWKEIATQLFQKFISKQENGASDNGEVEKIELNVLLDQLKSRGLLSEEINGEDRALQQLKKSHTNLQELSVSNVFELIHTRSSSDLAHFPSMWDSTYSANSPSSSCTDSPAYPSEGSYSKYNRVEGNLISRALAQGAGNFFHSSLGPSHGVHHLPSIEEPTRLDQEAPSMLSVQGEDDSEYIQVNFRVVKQSDVVPVIWA